MANNTDGDPRDLIKLSDVEITLKADKGPDVTLESFKVEDFTAKGDNYACLVTGVIVEYSLMGKPFQTSYVAKVNPRLKGSLASTMNFVFEKEIGFYVKLLPQLNKKLKESNESRLSFPKYFHSVDTNDNQVIYLEDLRAAGFRMYDRQKSLDKMHTDLILKELARLHASSVLLLHGDEEDIIDKTIERFPCLASMDKEMEKIKQETGRDHMSAMLESKAQLMDQIQDYQYVADFLRSKKSSVTNLIKALKMPREPFMVIVHADCWNNNFLFRYSSVGVPLEGHEVPLECRFVDLQAVKLSTPAIDLNYFLYTSITGSLRRAELPNFFMSYYATFASVLAGTEVAMKFTMSQLKKEFHDKNFYGFLMGLIVVQLALIKSEDTVNISDFFEKGRENAMKAYTAKVNSFVLKSPSLRPRLLDMFDEMEEYGLFKTSSVSNLVRRFSENELLNDDS